MYRLPTGKLPLTLLRKLVDKVRIEDEQVVLGPSIGEDVAVIRLDKKLLVATTDPITMATDLVGWYAVQVNANDIATSGVKPRWFMATILLAEESTHEETEGICNQILQACDSLGISFIGGHTEITHGLKRPIVIGCMLAETEDHPIITTSGAKIGDDIVLTKGIAIEGTAILAREIGHSILSSALNKDLLQRATNYLFFPGISVVKEATISASMVDVNCMHDLTEGGLSTGIYELATAAQVGIFIEERRIPILTESKTICERLAINPLGLLASGSLIITLPCSETSKLLEALYGSGINANIIGKVVEKEHGIKMCTPRGVQDLPRFERDELARFLDNRDSILTDQYHTKIKRKRA